MTEKPQTDAKNETHRRQLKQSTIDMYNGYLKSLKDVGINIYSPKMVLAYIGGMNGKNGTLSNSYIKGILSSILYDLRDKPQYSEVASKYREYVKKLREFSEKDEQDHEKISGKIPKWEEVLTAREEMLDEGKQLEHAILSLYTYIPPRRKMDYIKMIYIDGDKIPEDKDNNYYLSGSKQMVFNVYKTSGSFGQQIIDVPEELADVLSVWVEMNGVKSGDPLFNMTPLKLHRILNRVLGCSVNNIRHAYITKKYEEGGIPSSKDIEDTAKSMAHSVTSHLRYRKVESPPKKALIRLIKTNV